jgi:glycerol uptake facilitator-like aquaporin
MKNLQIIGMTILSQILGAYFGIIYAHFCLGAPALLCPYDTNYGCVSVDAHGRVFFLELWCTFFFCLCILCQVNAPAQETKDGVLAAGAIAFTLMAMIHTAGSISGGCFNPAFGLTQTTY